MAITDRLKSISEEVNTRLDELLDRHCEEGVLKDAMRYSLMAGGKRLRPALCIMGASLFGDERQALDIACAIEMIHTYSLIHDDLPSMDNDNLRRGKPTNHVVFGEAYAILAGDGLLNLAFEVMLRSTLERKAQPCCVEAMDIIARASGVGGMIAGQVADMSFEGRNIDKDVLGYIHTRKTAALIKASVLSGAVLNGATDAQRSALATYGDCIGLVFQIVDDLLDEVGDQEKIGKTLGKDAIAQKQTYATLYGIEQSRQIANEKTREAIRVLDIFGSQSDELKALATYLTNRDK